MKKLLLFIGLSLLLHKCILAQYNNNHPTIYLVSLSRDTVNLGDTLTINYFFDKPVIFPWLYTNAQIQLEHSGYGTIPFLYQTQNFYSLDTFAFISMYLDVWNVEDSLFKMTVTIPSTFVTGNSDIITTNNVPATFGTLFLFIRNICAINPINITGITTGTIDSTGSININITGGHPPFHFSWTDDYNFTSANENISGLVSGNYHLTVTDSLGCSTLETFYISNTASINNLEHNLFVTISPNPFTSQTTISFSSEQTNTTIKITDILGKEITTTKFNGKKYTIEKGEMQSGIYFVSVIDESKNEVNRKIIIQ